MPANIYYSGTGTGSRTFMSGSATDVPVSIRGASEGQSANLTEWRDATGVLLARVDSYGGFYVSGVGQFNGGQAIMQINPAGYSSGPVMKLAPGYGSHTALQIQAATSPSTSLVEIMNAAGTITSTIHHSGTIHVGASAILNSSGVVASIGAASVSASGTAIIARAASGQTANIQEWQNSAGNTMAFITPGGNFWFSPGGVGMKGLETGAVDSGGAGYRMVRVAN